MAYLDAGTGQPLVFIHGFPLSSAMWNHQKDLATQFRVIMLDLPGFGGEPTLPEPPSMASFASSIIRILDGLGIDKAAFCGLSMGGYILFEMWRRFPERITALILSDTRAEADTLEVKSNRQAGIQKIKQGKREELLSSYLPQLLAPESLKRPEVVELLRAMGQQASDIGLIHALQAMHDRPDSREILPSIKVPTLVVVGTEDSLTPLPQAQIIQQGIPHSHLVEIPHAGHLSPLENPESFNAALLNFRFYFVRPD